MRDGWVPLISEPIRLFVACAAGADAESQAVLEHTARSLTSRPLEIVWMFQAKKGFWSGWNTGSWRTPFTGFRWGIPAACGYEGRAIYTDSDFIFRADLAELWDQPIPGGLLIRRPDGKLASSAMLFDCARMQAHLPAIDKLKAIPDQDKQVRNYLQEHRDVMAAFAGDWNCTDLKGYESIDDPRIKAIHYSRMETQPHLRHAIKRLAAEGKTHWYTGDVGPHWRPDLIALFDQLLEEAVAAGYTMDRYQADAAPLQRRDFTYSTSKVAKK